MSKEKKVLFTRVIMGVLVALVLVLGSFVIINQAKINRLEIQIDNLREVNDSLEQANIENFVILTVIDDIDEETVTYLVDKTLEMSIYDFLLTTNKFTDDDFSSLDGEHFFFTATTPMVYYSTDVLELMDNDNYYTTDEWGSFLTTGLNKITINQNYTVKRAEIIF